MGEYQDGAGVCPSCGYVRGTPPREAYHLTPESILQGRYIVGRVLGFGGFGVTYIGFDAQLDRLVAIKEFLPTTFATRLPGETAVTIYEGNASQQFSFGLERFIDEAQRLAQFNGIPGVTDIYDTFWENNTAYIVMQFLKGRDVKVLLANEGPLPYERARDIILKICDTLTPVHAKGIIHRDISPDNIFMTDDGQVKLLDFGAARYESSVNSKSLSVILKSGYAPEEQYRSKGEQGSWTDVYALSATFYKLLTGVTPPDSMERAINDEMQEPSRFGVDMPQSAENAILNAMNIRKANRTQTVEEFKQALLADGVERIKEKPHKLSSNKVPIAVVVALVLCGILLAVFLMLPSQSPSQPPGVIEVSGDAQPPVLDTDFGSVVAEGNAQVPGLVGRTTEEAQDLLEDAGLVLEVEEREYSDNVRRGRVISQEPRPGLQLEQGEAVTVIVSLGTVEDAISDGLIPNPVGMSGGEGVAFVRNLGRDFYAEYSYVYSTTVPAGIITDFMRKPDGNWNWYEIYISAGPDNGRQPYGTPRAPLIAAGRGYMQFITAVASALYNDEDDPSRHNYATQWELLGSYDSTNWIKLNYQNMRTSPPYLTDEMKDRGAAPLMYLGFDSSRLRDMICRGALGSGTLRLRAEQYWFDWESQNVSMEERFLAAADFSQALIIDITPPRLRFTVWSTLLGMTSRRWSTAIRTTLSTSCRVSWRATVIIRFPSG